MAKYETPPLVRPLEKLITDFSYTNGLDPVNVFNDFLTYIIHGFSPGAPPLQSWKYKRQQNMKFMQMLTGWVRLMASRIKDDTSWYDPFGDLYMALVSKSAQQSQGQFFTPVHICDLMVLCTQTEEKKTGQRMGDPTCGSGRLLLAYHARNPGNYLIGEDINRTCCLMTVCNMLIHGCVGEVICHDSLNPGNFVDGWKVNPMLAWTGIPTIKRMNMEKYRAGRNLPASLISYEKRCQWVAESVRRIPLCLYRPFSRCNNDIKYDTKHDHQHKNDYKQYFISIPPVCQIYLLTH